MNAGARLVDRAWRGESRPLQNALAVPAALFRLAATAYHTAYDRGWLRSYVAPLPVVSIGNLTVGGTGKTPFARWVVLQLLERGARPAILHGGYANDEPALLRAWFPDLAVLVGKDRLKGIRQAAAAGATVAVLDDGFQHRRVRRDLDLVLVAAEDWDQPHHPLPRGRWREPPAALRRASIAVLTRKTLSAERAAEVAVELGRYGRPLVRAALCPAGWLDLAGGVQAPPRDEVVAVAGVGRPDLFFQNAAQAGARLSGCMAFRDHHVYDDADLAAIREAAGERGVVTTAKDAPKLATLAQTTRLWILDQRVEIEAGTETLSKALDRVITGEGDAR
jgi:tetraacyldisaccharide 4'-kinase